MIYKHALAEDFTVQHVGRTDYYNGSCGTSFTVQHADRYDYINGYWGDGRAISGVVQL
jgi:hypothetical protein